MVVDGWPSLFFPLEHAVGACSIAILLCPPGSAGLPPILIVEDRNEGHTEVKVPEKYGNTSPPHVFFSLSPSLPRDPERPAFPLLRYALPCRAATPQRERFSQFRMLTGPMGAASSDSGTANTP